MGTTLVVAFLVAHGLVHAAIWLPATEAPDPGAPFAPDHSAVLAAAHVAQRAARVIAAALALGSGAAYVLTGLGVGLSAGWTAAMAVVAAGLGLLLKLTFFNRWLLLGIALDVVVLSSALLGRPVSLA